MSRPNAEKPGLPNGPVTPRRSGWPQAQAYVAGPASTAQTASHARVTATDAGYRLAATLPAHGTITIHYAGDQPQRLNLIPVKRDRTRTQLAAYIRTTHGNDNAPAPPFARNGAQLGTSDISPRRRMQIYNLPAGEYATLDFGHDMKTGRRTRSKGCTRS
jgi:hypothetical protein